MLGLGSVSSPLLAQVLQGSVHDRETGSPITAAFVILLDERGERAAGVLTDGDGRFSRSGLPPGSYSPRVERIGFRRETFDPVHVPARGTVSVRLEVRSEAIELEAITAEGEGRCRMPREEGVLVSDLWEEVRKALEIAVWTESEPGIHVRARTHERVLDLVTLEAVEERGRTGGGFTRNPFFAHDPGELARDGYVQELEGGHMYYGLSADAILSRPFENTHCFRIRQPARGQPSTEIGLAFEPVPGRTTPDVSGVLWLDRETAELRRVEYEYTRHLHSVRLPEGPFGGATEFRRLENGAWIVDQWWIRAPEFERVVRSDQLPRGTVVRGGIATEMEFRRDFRRVGLRVREVGGSVLSVSLPGRRTAGTAMLDGVVHDSLVGRPMAGATVFVAGTTHEAVTDSTGAFSLTSLPAGEAEVGFHHPSLDLLGHLPETVMVRLGPRETTRISLASPSPRTLFSSRCGAEGEPVVGRVTSREDGAPMAGVLVVAEWEDWRREGDRAFAADRAQRGAVTDESGWYVVCGVAPGQGIRLRAEQEGEVRERTQVPVLRGEGGRADFRLRPLSPDRPGRIVGRVVSAETEAAVAGATIRLSDAGPTGLSDADGGFALERVPPGPATLRIEHIGYGPAEGRVEMEPGATLRVDVELYDRPIQLDEMVVAVEGRGTRVGRLAGFHERATRGMGGTFIHRDEIARRGPMVLSDMLPAHGIDVERSGRGTRVGLLSRRHTCAPMVYLDGHRVTHVPDRRSGDAIAEAGEAVNMVHPSDVEGVEVYRGGATVPGEFGGSSAQCGVIVIWTRAG